MDQRRKFILEGLGNLNPQTVEVYTGRVKSVDETNATCEVWPDPHDSDMILPVMLRSDTNDLSGIVRIPAVDSEITFAMIELGGEFHMINSSKLAKVLIDVPQLLIKCDDVIINDGNNNGVPISAKVVERLNKVEKELSDLKDVFTNWTVTPQDGGSALKLSPLMVAWLASKIVPTNRNDIENTKVKH